MAFKGDLNNVQLADLFQTLAQNRQEGVLTLSSRGATHRIAFRKEGVTLLDPAIGGRRRIGEILVSAGLIEEKDLAESLREQAKQRRFLGEILIEKGRVKAEDLEQILALQVEEEIYELFRAEAGTFEFTEGDPAVLCIAAGPGVRPLPVDQVVFEAARRLDEWGLIQRVVPSIEGVYVATVPPEKAEDDDAKAILARLDGRHSVRDVADALLSSPFFVAKVLARLVEQGQARPAKIEELFVTARELLTENQRNRALRFLHRLQEIVPNPSPLDAQLAELFKLAGDSKAAAQTRVKLASAARTAGKLDSARHELEVALKEWPGATPVLELLIQVLRDLKEPAAELQYARELAASQTDSGAVDGALRTMERVLELAPDDAEARRRYADLCLRAHLKEKAIEVLEKDAQRLKKDGAQAELAAVYKRILAIDGGRKDVKRALSTLRRSKTDRLLRTAAITLVMGSLLALGGFVGMRFHKKSRGAARLQEAAELLAAGDALAARDAVDLVLQDAPRPELAHDAMLLLDRIDERIAEATRGKRSLREEALSEKLAAIQVQVERLEFDTAISACVELLRAENEPFLVERAKTRLQVVVQSLLDHVARAKERTETFRMPDRDEDVGPVYARLSEAFPLALVTSLPRVHDEAFAAAKMLEGEPREWMHQVLTAIDAFDLMQARMKPQLEELRTRHVRLQTLEQLSVDYLEAARAAEAGNVERSRELLRKVLEEYGQGNLSGMLQQRLARLDRAAEAVQRVEKHLARGDHQLAYDEAHKAAEEFRDLKIPSTLTVPVVIDTLPRGARVTAGGKDAGTTPCIVRVAVGPTLGIELSIDGRMSQHLDLDAKSGARHVLEIPRRRKARGRLSGSALTAPIHDGSRFVVAGRDGTFHEVTPQRDGTLATRSWRSGSISGAHTAAVAVQDGFVGAVFEGSVFRVDGRGPELKVAWTRPLADEVRATPIAWGEQILVATGSGRVVALALERGEIAWQIPAGARRLAGEPARIEGRLYVPLVGGVVAVVSLAERKIELERSLGVELVHGLVTDGTALVALTTTGRLLRLDPATAEVRGSVELGDVPVDLPRVAAGFADVPLGKKVARVDLGQMVIASEWTGLAPIATPTAIDGRIWIPCEKDVVEVIDPVRGVVVERERSGAGELAGSPLAVKDGIVLLGRDGTFVLLER